jgi:photosystem II stability/assembly factor-like uncharacterized protein
MRIFISFCCALFLLLSNPVFGQRKTKSKQVTNQIEQQLFKPQAFQSLSWRNIGPFRGGRTNAVTGVPGDPLTYYFGSVGGGVWKSTDAGNKWFNISDGFFKTGSVGAITIAPSDNNVIYVGMGEHAVRGVMTSSGDGVYKSTDAGMTWKHVGLDNSKHISDIVVHPDNPEWVYVAVQGAYWNDSEDRGIYLSKDGGSSWEKILAGDLSSGAVDLVMDASNPRILYAALWDHRRLPWQVRSGGPGSAIYKSTDSGQSWKKIQNGLPDLMGKISVCVSPADPQRLYANIEAEGEQGGVYRSDNGGKSWRQVYNDRVSVARAWYYIEIFADPQDAETVYVLNAPLLKSIDGGKTFSPIPNPHTDQHDLWINPDNPNNMILGNDGGACISFNGGKTWSTQNNQATAQFYRVITDNQFPYHIYAGQQDNSTVAISSKTARGGIDFGDWYPVAGGESAFIAFDDPDKPRITYGTSIQGFIDAYDIRTKTTKDIMQYPSINLGNQPEDQPYRWNWNNPLINGYKAKNVLYHGANVVFESEDGGYTWKEISPDLTRNDISKHNSMGVPFTNEAAGGEVYNTISYLANSKHDPGVLYAGSDDGLIHVRLEEGGEWSNISPRVEGESLVNAIEVSPHNPAKVYAVLTRYKFGDHRPFIFKSEDYGKNWVRISDALVDSDFVRVVREDPKRAGVLYAGTERGVYISFDDGISWHPFQSNLPICPITDLIVKDNDLVAATSGRGFWILDDITVLQESKGVLDSTALMLFQAKPTHKFTLGASASKEIGQNPLPGIILDYHLPHTINDSSEIDLKIFNDEGQLIRSFSNKKPEGFKSWPGGPAMPVTLPAKKGLNRFNWDLRREHLPGIENVFVFGSPFGTTVSPGTYTLKLSCNDLLAETSIEVLADPRIQASPDLYAAQEALLGEMDAIIRSIHASVNNGRMVQQQLNSIITALDVHEGQDSLMNQAKKVLQLFKAWELQLIQPKQKTFQDVINFENKLSAEFVNLQMKADAPDPRQPEALITRFNELKVQWDAHKSALDSMIEMELADFNKAYRAADIPVVVYPKTKG